MPDKDTITQTGCVKPYYLLQVDGMYYNETGGLSILRKLGKKFYDKSEVLFLKADIQPSIPNCKIITYIP